jgi:hypothetical protein
MRGQHDDAGASASDLSGRVYTTAKGAASHGGAPGWAPTMLDVQTQQLAMVEWI